MKVGKPNKGQSSGKQSLPHELFRFVTENANYKDRHKKINDPDSATLLGGFLFATLDEVRLYYADRYAYHVLKTTDIEDACHFRQGVLRREASGDIEYHKQRDHAAHTLHNYLLGWYVYENNAHLRGAMRHAMAVRLSPVPQECSEDQGRHRFFNIWPYVSLLHDIGYLFEGGLEALRIDLHSDHVRCGAEVVQEYFRNRFWSETPLAAATERAKVRKWTGITEPDFSPFTVTAVGDSLRALGNLEIVWAWAIKGLHERKIDTTQLTALDFKGQGDAFEVWRRHYRAYSPAMVNRVDQLEKAFYAMMWDGLPGIGVRVLDHGVAGGLLQLLYATYYFQMHFGLIDAANKNPNEPDLQDLVARIKARLGPTGVVYNAFWWWTSIVWATGATALHNLQQMDQPWPGCQTTTGPLAIEDDPLAYLGILVDVMQEWDRYTVSRTSIFTGILPLQGKDVSLCADSGIIHVNYADAKRSKKVKESLAAALIGWDKVVNVLPAS